MNKLFIVKSTILPISSLYVLGIYVDAHFSDINQLELLLEGGNKSSDVNGNVIDNIHYPQIESSSTKLYGQYSNECVLDKSNITEEYALKELASMYQHDNESSISGINEESQLELYGSSVSNSLKTEVDIVEDYINSDSTYDTTVESNLLNQMPRSIYDHLISTQIEVNDILFKTKLQSIPEDNVPNAFKAPGGENDGYNRSYLNTIYQSLETTDIEIDSMAIEEPL